MPIKFPLKMRGVDVRNLEDLKKHFDFNATIEYFKNGKLIQWLKARYHDDLADKVSALNENASDFRENICAVLGISCDEKSFRDDGGIVYEMFQWDEDGNIISSSNDTVAAAVTEDEKEYQPVNQNKSSVNDELRDIFETIFDKRDIWEVINRDGKIITKSDGGTVKDTSNKGKVSLIRENYIPKNLTPTQKKMFLKMVCEGKYTEDDLIFIRVVEDFSSGFAFTKDSFCIGGDLYDYQNAVSKKFRTILYKEITSIEFGGSSSDWAKKEIPSLRIRFKDDSAYNNQSDVFFYVDNVQNEYTTQIITENILWKIGKFLEFVKD